jgi:hypothetical protein
LVLVSEQKCQDRGLYNTLSFHSPNFDEVVNVLQQESNILINWFHFNCMQANTEKFQAIAVGKKSFDKSIKKPRRDEN